MESSDNIIFNAIIRIEDQADEATVSHIKSSQLKCLITFKLPLVQVLLFLLNKVHQYNDVLNMTLFIFLFLLKKKFTNFYKTFNWSVIIL